MSDEDTTLLLWLVSAVLFGLYARTSEARVSMPSVIGFYYKYLFWHALFCTVATVFGLLMLRDVERYTSDGDFWMTFWAAVAFATSAGFGWYFWAFDRFDPEDPNRLPVGVQLWAEFSPKALSSRQDGLVDTDALANRANKRRPSRSEITKAKEETHRAEVEAYELMVAKEYEEAQAELARKAREYNEAKLRAEEAKRRRDKQ